MNDTKRFNEKNNSFATKFKAIEILLTFKINLFYVVGTRLKLNIVNFVNYECFQIVEYFLERVFEF